MSVVRAEWIKLRSVRGRLIALIAAAVAMVVFSVFSAAGERRHCSGPTGCPSLVVGPGGQAVVDSYEFVDRPLAGDGTLTVRVSSLAGAQPWAKAGLLITASTEPGSSYAAVMVAAGHGVRFQYDYTHDVSGPQDPPGAPAARWLRLVRAGDTVTGYASADGSAWTRIGAARLSGAAGVVRAGMFVTSPQNADLTEHPFVTSGAVLPTLATAAFSDLTADGAWPAANWTGRTVGPPDDSYPVLTGGSQRLGDGSLQISGSGDIAPAVGGVEGTGVTIDHTLAGGFVALILVIAVGTLSATSEYRRGLIRTTLAATPRRGRVLAAKAVVIGGSTFLLMVSAAALSLVLGKRVLLANHDLLYPATVAAQARVVVGTAGLIAVAAVVALALGVVFRRSGAAITVAVVAIVLPYILFQALPTGASEWLLRVTPTAALAIQQTLPVYRQVAIGYTPVNGYYPLAPWAGFAVLCTYGVATLALAAWLLGRRDA
ncbi:ABC transporter permease subunit [Catenulispora subtropica]|uniref:DUF1349 domain-containing protein n=1 Tax=Catenulispora subtropica TaxID=450798 RepID=A0ABN2S4I0_9ACTN